LGSSHQSMPWIKRKRKRKKKKHNERSSALLMIWCAAMPVKLGAGDSPSHLLQPSLSALVFWFLDIHYSTAALSHMIIKLMRITSALSTFLTCIYLKWSAFLPLSKKEASLLIHVAEKFLFWSLNLFLFSPAAPS
jgi:hypothetical protein